MKSIKYAALTCLFVASLNMNAMEQQPTMQTMPKEGAMPHSGKGISPIVVAKSIAAMVPPCTRPLDIPTSRPQDTGNTAEQDNTASKTPPAGCDYFPGSYYW